MADEARAGGSDEVGWLALGCLGVLLAGFVLFVVGRLAWPSVSAWLDEPSAADVEREAEIAGIAADTCDERTADLRERVEELEGRVEELEARLGDR